MRNQTIEVMKGLCITGVVLLHAVFIHYGENNSLSIMLRLVCVNAFLFLSGYVVYGKINNQWVIQRVIRFLPLLAIFTSIYWLLGTYVVGIDGGENLDIPLGNFYLFNLFIGFNGLILWYIWQLLLCYGALLAVEKVKVNFLLKMSIAIVFIVLIPLDGLGLNFLKWYGLFILAGYTWHYIVDYYRVYKLVMVAMLFPFSFLIPLTYQSPYINGGYVDIARAIINGESVYILYYLIVAVSGIALLYLVSRLLVRVKWLTLIASSSIGILLLHKIFLEVNLIDNLWLSAIIAEILALGLYQLLKRVKILDYILFGGTDIPIKISNKIGGWYVKAQA
jgi:hypothetical protein